MHPGEGLQDMCLPAAEKRFGQWAKQLTVIKEDQLLEWPQTTASWALTWTCMCVSRCVQACLPLYFLWVCFVHRGLKDSSSENRALLPTEF